MASFTSLTRGFRQGRNPQAGDAGEVKSFNTRTGAVSLSKADVTGTGLAASDVGAAATASNLSDLASAASARVNLGLPIRVLPLSGDNTGVADRTAIASLVTALGASGGIIQLPPGVAYVDQLSALAGTSNIWLRGCGDGSTTLVFTSAAGIADLTGTSFFTCSDMLIRSSVQRTAEFFHLDAGGPGCQRNRFQRLRVASPYRLATLLTATTSLFEDIQFLDFNAGWTVNAGISLDGATTSTIIRNIRGGTAAGMTNALINVTGSTVDTVIGEDWDILGLSGADMLGLQVTNGEWMRFTDISIESANSRAVYVTGGTGIDLHNVHLLGYRGLDIEGVNGLSLVGGEILRCQREGVYVAAISAVHNVHIGGGLRISDVSQATTNTYNGIYFSGLFSYFSVADCVVGGNDTLGLAHTNKYGIQIDAGSDYYRIVNNRTLGATGQILDNGGGAHTTVSGNI